MNRIFKKVKRQSVYAYHNAKHLLGLNKKFFKNARGSRIVVYHGICIEDHLKFNGIFLKKVAFEEHLRYYKKYFNIVSIDDYFKGNFDDNKFNICITFDDGYLNNYKYVLPLMQQYQIPVTFFITAIRDAGYDILWNDFLGIVTKYGSEKISFNNETFLKAGSNYVSEKTKRPLVEYLRKQGFAAKEKMIKDFSEIVSFRNKKEDEDFWMQMSIDQIKSLSESPFATIGAHGYYHNDLAEIPIAESAKELLGTKNFLEKICGKEIKTIAFPYGHYTREAVHEATKIGYSQLYALDFYYREDKTDNTIRERQIINPYLSVINQMYAIVKGKYE